MQPINRTVAILACVAFALALAGEVSAAALSAKNERRVRDATLEVVIAQPTADPLSYEKALPLELLPFALRTATHLPIGTAFCIGPNQYVSAGHVLAAMAGSQWGAPLLRDRAGNLYEIDQVLRYSSLEDFVLFSLKSAPESAALEVSTPPSISETVFAVGNALGEGIIIRDGLFTSVTPEPLNGSWNFLRFSAAASPGNSGGPLLDQKGRVIGVVVAKSPSENLNYALPIQRVVEARKTSATIMGRGAFAIPYSTQTIVSKVDEAFVLPLTYPQFSASLLKVSRDVFDRNMADLAAANADRFFPRGDGSLELLYSSDPSTELRLIVEKNGKWAAEEPDEWENTDLGNGGRLEGGTIAELGMARIWLPDDVESQNLIADSRAFMDLFLKGVPVTRIVGPEAVRVTSLGPAISERVFNDRYRRKWLLRTWQLPFMDAQITSAALPIPGGFVVLSKTAPTGAAYQASALVEVATNLVDLAYAGTLEEWREYLKIESLAPDVFEPAKLAVSGSREVSLKTPRFDIRIGDDLLNIDGDTELHLLFSYMPSGDTVVWDIGGLTLRESAEGGAGIYLKRHPRPPESMGSERREIWKRMLQRLSPFDSAPYVSDGVLMVDTTVTRQSPTSTQSIPSGTSVIYEVAYLVQAGFSRAEIQALQTAMLQGLQIKEE